MNNKYCHHNFAMLQLNKLYVSNSFVNDRFGAGAATTAAEDDKDGGGWWC